MILVCMHVFLLASSLGKKGRFSRYNYPHILCICSKALQSDDRLLCDIEISGKTQNYHLESVCNFRVTRVYLILPCKQHYWTPGTYSIEISTWSYENRVNKHVVIFLNFPCLIALHMFTVVLAYVFFFFACFVVTDLCRSGCRQ